MEIRKSTELDVGRMMEIFAHARRFMAEHGNPNQWGPRNWPPEALIRQDIEEGNSYVCIDEGRIVGTFFFVFGKDAEPTYAVITGGAWLDDSPYGVIHRIASDGTKKGVGECCINWALQQCPHLRVDTHEDNKVVQNCSKSWALSTAARSIWKRTVLRDLPMKKPCRNCAERPVLRI